MIFTPRNALYIFAWFSQNLRLWWHLNQGHMICVSRRWNEVYYKSLQSQRTASLFPLVNTHTINSNSYLRDSLWSLAELSINQFNLISNTYQNNRVQMKFQNIAGSNGGWFTEYTWVPCVHRCSLTHDRHTCAYLTGHVTVHKQNNTSSWIKKTHVCAYD